MSFCTRIYTGPFLTSLIRIQEAAEYRFVSGNTVTSLHISGLAVFDCLIFSFVPGCWRTILSGDKRGGMDGWMYSTLSALTAGTHALEDRSSPSIYAMQGSTFYSPPPLAGSYIFAPLRLTVRYGPEPRKSTWMANLYEFILNFLYSPNHIGYIFVKYRPLSPWRHVMLFTQVTQ